MEVVPHPQDCVQVFSLSPVEIGVVCRRCAVVGEDSRPRLARGMRFGRQESVEHLRVMEPELLGEVGDGRAKRLFCLAGIQGA